MTSWHSINQLVNYRMRGNYYIVDRLTENVYDTVTGRALLIPQGSRLIGTYDSVIAFGQPRQLYEELYCARGQAENLIKLHKTQLASGRTSCQSPVANQVRLVLHTAAYWLMLTLRDALPAASALARAEFATLRLRLLKLGARVIEKAARIRIHLASACPDATLFRLLAGRLAAAGP